MNEPKVLISYPTAMISCPCTGSISLIVVTGFNNFSKCGNCGKLFSITGMEAAAEGQLPGVLVSIVLPTAAKDVM